MQVTKREGYAIKNENEISLRAEASSQQETSAAQTQELAQSPNQTKAASDLANGRKFDDRFQANLLKNHLSGLEKNATKFAGENVGVIKDNLGKDIKRHDGPGVKDMFKMGRKQGLGGGNPLADQPSIDRGKKLPDMPYRRNDPSLVSSGTVTRVCKTVLTGEDPKPDDKGGTKLTGEDPKRVCKTVLTGADPKPKDGTKKYVDSDPSGYGGGTGQIDRPEERPLNAHDRLGHKVDGGNNLVPEYDAKSAIQAHKDRENSLVYKDPEQQATGTIDTSNSPNRKGEELKNTGNPIDNNAPRPAAPRPKQEGSKPHTDGEGTQ